MPPNDRSRFSFSLAITDDGRENRLFLETRPRMVFENRPDNRLHQVAPGESLHAIAWVSFFGLIDRPYIWWWMIADYNNILDPTRALEAGREIWIPSDSKIDDWFADPDRVV